MTDEEKESNVRMAVELRALADCVDASDDVCGVVAVATLPGGKVTRTFGGEVTASLVGNVDIVRHRLLSLLDEHMKGGA